MFDSAVDDSSYTSIKNLKQSTVANDFSDGSKIQISMNAMWAET